MNYGTTIRYALSKSAELAALVAEAAAQEHTAGFFFCEILECWGWWTIETPDATASNTYYTPEECRALLIEHGFADLLLK